MKSPALVFKWPNRHRIHLLLPAMLILAALAHAGIFFLFSVANPPLQADALRPARAYFLTEGSPELAQLESTLASNDPALFAPLHGSSTHREPVATYTPQYASAKNALLSMPPRPKTSDTPPPQSGAVPLAKPWSMPVTAIKKTTSNRLTASNELASRLPNPPRDDLVRREAKSNAVDSASFFVGITSDGTIAHILPNRSSGDADLDLETLQALKSVRFAPAENAPITWGFVHFQLGTEPSPPSEP